MGIRINFFWYGDNFHYLHYLTLRSHIYVGHDVIIHLHGNCPNSIYWDIISNNIIIKDAETIFSINNFLNAGGNIKTASDLWRFHFLYEHGGWYSDCDAVALKPWDIKTEWMLCSGETKENTLSIGVIKSPAGEMLFRECINNIKYNWGNVDVLSKIYKEYKNNNRFLTNPVVYDSEYFYPVLWNEYNKLLDDIKIPEKSLSIHLFNTMFEREYGFENLESLVMQNKNSLLYKLHQKYC